MKLKINYFDKYGYYVIAFALMLFFLTEAISKYSLVTNGINSQIPKYTKSLFFLFFLLNLVFQNLKRFFLLLLLVLFFCLGQFFLEHSFSSNAISTLLKYLFPILALSFCSDKEQIVNNKIIFNVFEIIIFLNSLLIIIGFLFSLPLMETYTYGSRFGYNGLFINSTTGTYVYLIGLFYFLIRYKTKVFKKIGFPIFLIALLLVGTKLLYLSLAFSCIYYLYFLSNFKFKNIIFLIIFTLGSLFLFITFYRFGIFNEIRQESGLLSAIFSFRNELLFEDTLPYIDNNWTFLNYLFGGVENYNLRSEFGFLDEFFFFGIVGGLLYLYLFYKSFFVFAFNKKNLAIVVFFSFLILIAGNFFSYATVSIYIIIMRETFSKYLS